MAARVEALVDRDLMLIEGTGGVLVRWTRPERRWRISPLLLSAPAVVVARAALGTLNHTGLTCEALRARGVRCLGVVVGAWPARPDLAARCNLEDLPRYTAVPLLGRLREGAGQLHPPAFTQLAIAELWGVQALEAEHAHR